MTLEGMLFMMIVFHNLMKKAIKKFLECIKMYKVVCRLEVPIEI